AEHGDAVLVGRAGLGGGIGEDGGAGADGGEGLPAGSAVIAALDAVAEGAGAGGPAHIDTVGIRRVGSDGGGRGGREVTGEGEVIEVSDAVPAHAASGLVENERQNMLACGQENLDIPQLVIVVPAGVGHL